MATAGAKQKVGILVGGGPAPGINGVIAAATIRSLAGGCDVIGIQDGFKWLMEGRTDKVRPLTLDAVGLIHFNGGSCLGTARANPTKDVTHLDVCLAGLATLDIDRLITIGGDDTAFSALKLEARAAGRLQVVHVPKTIDNDLDLPNDIPTFGFQTARQVGVALVKSLLVDAETTSRWYFVVTMGRKAGHLALGIGKAAGATVTLIPEEFSQRPLRLSTLVDTVVGAVIKRLSEGRSDGVAVLAEGLVECLDPQDLDGLNEVERDQHGHVRLAEVNFGVLLKRAVERRLRESGITLTLVDKNIGYELRCTDPIAFDMEYTRDLGCCAAQYLLDGRTAAMVSIQNGRFVPIPFQDILDPSTGRTRVRMVDVTSESYAMARRYMTRLGPDDFANADALARHAKTAGVTPEAFRRRFSEVIAQASSPDRL